MPDEPFRIAVIASIADPDWRWIERHFGVDDRVDGRRVEWRYFSIHPALIEARGLAGRIAASRHAFGRLIGARALAKEGKRKPFDLIVSHGPWASAWTELAGRDRATRHLAFAFNFTNLPTGFRKAWMGRAYRRIDGFAVLTETERRLYPKHFGLNPARFHLQRWGGAAPIDPAGAKADERAPFVALGGEARDYETLFEAARRLPDLRFAAIARRENVEGLTPPANVRVDIDLPFEEAWRRAASAPAMLIPLRSRETPCGLVTLIGAMHLGKAIIASDAAGMGEYLRDGETGLLVPPKDPDALAAAIGKVNADQALAARLGAAAQAQARAQYTEAETVRWFRGLLSDWFMEEKSRRALQSASPSAS